jgi:hypothetical protein
MKAIVKLLIVSAVVLVAIVFVVGAGRVVAGAEYPFGVGPWSSNGHYCRAIYEMSYFVDERKHSGRATLSTSQRLTWLEFEKSLTKTGPQVPRADFIAWYRTTGYVSTRKTAETTVLNAWWNQNCTAALMEAPASVSHVWSVLGSHTTFAHYPKNVIHLRSFLKVIP